MTWRRPHWRERPSHPEDDLRPHEGNESGTLISSRALARGISGPWDPAEISRDGGRAFLSSASQGTNSGTHPGESPAARLKAEAHLLCTASYLRPHHGAGGFRKAAQVPP